MNSRITTTHSPRSLSPASSPQKSPRQPMVPFAARELSLRLRKPSRFELQATSQRSDGGAGVMDRPSLDEDVVKKEHTSSERPPIYKLLLHNDDFNRREYVVQMLMKTVEGISVDDAVNIMQEAHETGLALVTVCSQEEAENYCESLRGAGLISTIEPDCKPGPGNASDN